MIANLTRDDFCSYCLNEGQVVVSTRREKWPRRITVKGQTLQKLTEAEVDEYGPCPACERGKRLEFPPPDAKGNPRHGPWGPDGYWRGRSPELEPRMLSPQLPTSENAARLKELRKQIGMIG